MMHYISLCTSHDAFVHFCAILLGAMYSRAADVHSKAPLQRSDADERGYWLRDGQLENVHEH
jgi:hypothetical protein